MNLFKFIRKSIVLYSILCAFCSVVSVILCFYCVKYNNNVWLCFFKDISVIIATTFAVSLLIGLLIEKSSKEDFYVDLTRHTISSDTFANRLTDYEKNLLCKSINKKFRCNNNNALYDIYSNFEERFVAQNFAQDYYIEECKYDITCTITENFIEKHYTKTMYFKSYSNKHSLNELILGQHRNKFYGDKPNFQLTSLKIGEKTLNDKEREKYIKKEPLETCEPLDAGHDYNNKFACKYKKKIVLDDSKPTVVTYKYTTRTELSDEILTVRCSKPCKKFSVDFTVQNTDYSVAAVAFGFIDTAKGSPETSNKQHISVEFRDWILPEDGVVLFIKKDNF